MLTSLASLAVVAARQPAVSDTERTLAFDELFRLAGGVATRITEVDPEGTAPVAVLVDQGIDSVVALFGVLLAGRAFAALETEDPPQRSADIVARLGARVVVSVSATAIPGLPDRVEIMSVPQTGESEVALPRVLDRDLAAVVFTSGSTGRPKGVRLDHAVLESMTQSVRRDVTGSSGYSTVPGLARFSFAAGLTSLWEVAAGCHLKLRDLRKLGPMELVEWFDAERFATVSLVPSVARAVLERSTGDRCLEHVRALQTYGEALRWSDVGPLRTLAPDAVITVSYGATEAGGRITEFAIRGDDPIAEGVMPLGRPVPEKEISLEPITNADDAPAEIVVRGAIAAGYWDSPALEAERFGTDPDGTRFWRSGDLARRVDGSLVHCGRVDDLVKVSGVLVEPAEVERALLSLPDVANAAVLGQPAPGRVRLVAHVQPRTTDVDPIALKRALREQLSPHLVPSVFVRHDDMPVMIRGKIDRGRLRTEPLHPWRTSRFERPRGEREHVIVGSVIEILGFESELDLGRDDDFFDVGLDSLGVLELVAALDDSGLGPLGTRDVLECPTARLLAERCERPVMRDGPVVLNGEGDHAPIWIVAGAGGTALTYRALADCLGPAQPLIVLEAAGLHDDREPLDTVEAEAEGHLTELVRTRERRALAAPDEPILLAGHSWGGLVAYEMAVQLHRSGVPVSLFLIDAGAPSPGLTVRQRLARLAKEPWRARPHLRRHARHANDLPRIVIRRLRPMPDPMHEQSPGMRYDLFYRRGVASGSQYRVPSAAFSVTLGVADKSTRAAFWRSRVARLTVVQLSGSHNGLLQHPNVMKLADEMEAAFRSAAPAPCL
jgi:acyl-CoA synthetase (AMP-forming)/AMP-acid ligase II/thioesterase domain-containing protein/aryl carrier-like protein